MILFSFVINMFTAAFLVYFFGDIGLIMAAVLLIVGGCQCHCSCDENE